MFSLSHIAYHFLLYQVACDWTWNMYVIAGVLNKLCTFHHSQWSFKQRRWSTQVHIIHCTLFAQRFSRQFAQSAFTTTTHTDTDSVHWIKNSRNCLTYCLCVCSVNQWSDLCVMTAICNLGHLDFGFYYNYLELGRSRRTIL